MLYLVNNCSAARNPDQSRFVITIMYGKQSVNFVKMATLMYPGLEPKWVFIYPSSSNGTRSILLHVSYAVSTRGILAGGGGQISLRSGGAPGSLDPGGRRATQPGPRCWEARFTIVRCAGKRNTAVPGYLSGTGRSDVGERWREFPSLA